MRDLLKYINDNSIDYYIIFTDNFNVIRCSSNLYDKKINNIKSLIWLEDVGRFEQFVKNIKRERWSIGHFEISLNEKTYQKVPIISTTFEGNNLMMWGRPSVKTDKIESDKTISDNFLQLFEPFLEIILDKNYKIVEIYKNTFTINLFHSSEIINKSYLDYVSENDLNEFKIFHEKVVEDNIYQKLEYCLKNSENETFWVEESVKKIKKNEQIYYHCLIKDINKEKQFKLNLINEKNQALHLANHLEKTREQERKNMAREIHDEIGHALTSLKLDMNLLIKKKFMREDALISRLNDMMKQIEETIRTVQQISAQLRPSILDHFGLIAALEWQAKEFQRQTSIRCKYSFPDEDVEIPENKTIAIFRIFQEVLTNIARHSQATRVDINLTIENNILELQVSDNGIGIKKEHLNSPTSLGLIGMNERAKLIGGKLILSSVINVGATITLTVAIK